MNTESEDDNRDNAWKVGRSRRVSTGFLVKIIVSGGAVAWVVWGMDWSGFSSKLQRVNWFIMVLSAGVFSSMLLPSAFRWRGVTAVCGIPISWSQSLRYYLIGGFFHAYPDVAHTAISPRVHVQDGPMYPCIGARKSVALFERRFSAHYRRPLMARIAD